MCVLCVHGVRTLSSVQGLVATSLLSPLDALIRYHVATCMLTALEILLWWGYVAIVPSLLWRAWYGISHVVTAVPKSWASPCTTAHPLHLQVCVTVRCLVLPPCTTVRPIFFWAESPLRPMMVFTGTTL